MTGAARDHRASGLEPDNLLAFLALVGTMRALDAAGPPGAARVSWSVDRPPVRPVLHLAEAVTREALTAAVAAGVRELAAGLAFDGRRDLTVTPAQGRELLMAARTTGAAAAWSALVSDAAVAPDGRRLERTPLCVLMGQGHQHFLSRLAGVPAALTPPARGQGSGRPRVGMSEAACLEAALFETWTRADASDSFRWDPREDVRYAMRATDPSDSGKRGTTEHGANRLAAVGLPALTASPRASGAGPRLAVRGGGRDRRGRFTLTWPVWREPIGLACLLDLLDHPRLDDPATRSALGVAERRRTTRVVNGKFMNFTDAESV